MRVMVVHRSAITREAAAAVVAHDLGASVTTAADGALARSRLSLERHELLVVDADAPRAELALAAASASGTRVILCGNVPGAAVIASAILLILPDRLASALASGALTSALGSAPESTGRKADPAAYPVVAIGASTGGIDALRRILRSLPADAPPTVIVQHTLANTASTLAATLGFGCSIAVKLADDGDALIPGRVLVAAAGHHLRVVIDGAALVARSRKGEPRSGHCPSVDVLFDSVAEACRGHAVGVLLTGMGSDGADGLLAMRCAGATTIAQDERTSVVFGMPKRAIEKNAVDFVLPIELIAAKILANARRRARA